MTDQLESLLISQLSSYGIECSQQQASQMVRHLNLVIEKNKVVNLTRIVDPIEAVSLHLVDSLLPLALEVVSLDESMSFVDIGTGAGFPGIPIGILTGAHGVLVDSVNKKTCAVNEFINQLHLPNLKAVHSRVEDLPREMLLHQDFVFARAVAQSNVLIEYATPLLKMNGLLVLEKANPSDDELSAARRASSICGLSFVSRETFELPNQLGHREILVFKKISKPKISLPRKAGIAKLSPLGIS